MSAEILNNKNSRFLGLICLAICMVIFIAGLWPTNFHPKNEVEWLPNKNGVHFFGRGIAYTPELINLNSFLNNNSVTFEILLETLSETKSSGAHLLSLYNGKETEIITFRQWESTLEIFRNKKIDENKPSPNSRIGLRDALISGEKRLITVSSEKEGTKIYLNGNFTKFYPNFSIIANSKVAGQLILGNSPTGKNSWTGNIFGLAIYNRSLKEEEVFQNYQNWLKNGSPITSENESFAALYLFNEHYGTLVHNKFGMRYDLLIPKTFHMLQKTILTPPWRNLRLNLAYLSDIFINIIGFIPFGFFFSAFLLKNTSLTRLQIYVIILLLGSIISLTIEIIQVYLPTRSSSFTDLICNILGVIIGTIIFQFSSIFMQFMQVLRQGERKTQM